MTPLSSQICTISEHMQLTAGLPSSASSRFFAGDLTKTRRFQEVAAPGQRGYFFFILAIWT